MKILTAKKNIQQLLCEGLVTKLDDQMQCQAMPRLTPAFAQLYGQSHACSLEKQLGVLKLSLEETAEKRLSCWCPAISPQDGSH